MRLIVIKQPIDLHELSSKLLKIPSAAGPGALERVRAMNPHVDFRHLAAGTVLLVPDLPGLQPSDGKSIGGDAFDAFAADIEQGLKAAALRVRAGLRRLSADDTAMQAALKTDAVKRALGADPLFKQQLTDTRKRFETAQEQSQDAAKSIEALQKSAAESIAVLGKLLR